MPTVDLTARLARETKPGDRGVFLFDRALPGFGWRVHRSGAKAWIVHFDRADVDVEVAASLPRRAC